MKRYGASAHPVVSGETVIPIKQYLVARPGVGLTQIKVLYAHPQSLGQCRRFIERCLPGVATIASLSNSAAPAEALRMQQKRGAPVGLALSIGQDR